MTAPPAARELPPRMSQYPPRQYPPPFPPKYGRAAFRGAHPYATGVPFHDKVELLPVLK